MKKSLSKALALFIALAMVFGVLQVGVFAAEAVDYTITNPYEGVTSLLGKDANHYKTNLHTHSTYSDADITLSSMVKGHYGRDFDILGMADHGVIGTQWNKEPTLIPLYIYNNVLNGQEVLTDDEFSAILNGTFKYSETTRTNKRGMQCVTGGIEGNMLVAQKNHVNGYFVPAGADVEGFLGEEGDFETVIEMFEDLGAVSHINHPGDWLGSGKRTSATDENGEEISVRTQEGIDIATNPENVQFFANILRKYSSCLGIEVYNAYDRPTCNDRMLWDELLKVLIPEGRNVWGFGNNDAHNIDDIDTSFMDFVLPSYSQDNLRQAMTKGQFFAVSRYDAGNRIGNTKAYPQVTSITVKDTDGLDTITIVGKNTENIKWIADGKVIKATETVLNGVVTSEITLQDYSDDISCYVRAELEGAGGKTLTQAFVCDDGTFDDIETNGPAAIAPIDAVALIRSILKFFYRTFMDIFK